jgi:D-mannonate dehydratase
LEQSLGQLAELDQLIVELPGIFERKFAQRLQPLLERQRLLSEDNHALREHLQRVLPPAREGQARLGPRPADPAGSDQVPASPSPAQGKPVWRRRLQLATRRLLRRGP